MELPDLNIFHKMRIGAECRPVKPLKTIEEIQVDEIIPEKIKRQRRHYGKYRSRTAPAHGPPSAERSVTAAFLMPLRNIIVTVSRYFILQSACFPPYLYLFMYNPFIKPPFPPVKKTQEISPAFFSRP